MRRRLRFAVARLLARIPGGCQQTVWQWANRRTRRPWARVQPGCRESAIRYGWCPCGQLTDDMEWLDNGGAGGLL